MNQTIYRRRSISCFEYLKSYSCFCKNTSYWKNTYQWDSAIRMEIKLRAKREIRTRKFRYLRKPSIGASMINLSGNSSCIHNIEANVCIVKMYPFSWEKNPKMFGIAPRNLSECICLKFRLMQIDPHLCLLGGHIFLGLIDFPHQKSSIQICKHNQ